MTHSASSPLNALVVEPQMHSAFCHVEMESMFPDTGKPAMVFNLDSVDNWLSSLNGDRIAI